ncbi:MAG TPA: adenylate/guanylate cyclase domain-containing protein, partial [Dehalococcoidia bacterium]|nr:adenylate/guanylate cyclase domain-containing protein [Dehalococcoidia bacterium]
MQIRPVSVLFLDLTDFGRLSVERPPEALAAMLNAFFEGLGAIIARHGGSIDKYMGDAVLVTFNATSDQSDHARRAVQTAVEGVRWVRDE